jgi:ABC-type transporter Mla subunit MlaD
MKVKSIATDHIMKTLLFALLAAVITCSTVGCSKTAPPGCHLSARFNFNTVRTLIVGDPVMMAGLQVGQVEAIVLDPAPPGTNIKMKINHSVVVKTDSVASVNASSSPDQSCITLTVGSATAPAVAEGSILLSSE